MLLNSNKLVFIFCNGLTFSISTIGFLLSKLEFGIVCIYDSYADFILLRFLIGLMRIL